MTAANADTHFKDRMAETGQAVNAFLDLLLTPQPRTDEAGRPAPLLDAMRHGVLNGGKRFRPFLVIETARLIGRDDGGPGAGVLHIAAALECIHCYSLIHDDLPAMDDDDLRRGQPTVHKAFGEAAAILAGDALLTEAFALVSAPENGLGAQIRARLVQLIARAAGLGGMVGGQMYDLMAETASVEEVDIVRTQAMKTGALIRASCEAGAIAGGGNSDDLERLGRFGATIGLAFQLADDLLDETADAETVGKQTHKDAGAGKQTLVGIHGHDWARTRLSELVDQASDALRPYGERAAILREAARFVASRQS